MGHMTVDAAATVGVVSTYLVIGAVVAAARPHNRLGPVLVLGALLWGLGDIAVELAHRAGADGGAVAPWAVPGSALRALGWLLVVAGVPLLYPDGAITYRGRRWPINVLVVAATLTTIGTVTDRDADLTGLNGWHNPLALDRLLSAAGEALSSTASLLGTALGVVAVAGAVTRLVARWQHGVPLMRQQVVLFALAAAMAAVAAPAAVLVGPGAFDAAAVVLAMAVGTGVLVRDVYELRTATNRAMVWTTLAASIIALYALVIAGVGGLMDAVGARWLAWVAAAVVAICFAPLRDLLQRAVNRLTHGDWDDPYAVLAGLNSRLGAAIDATKLTGEAVAVLTELGLTHVVVRDARGEIVAGVESVGGARLAAVPLSAYGQHAGMLSYNSPAQLRAQDRHLLEQVAAQIAAVLHTRTLALQLQESLTRVVQAQDQERTVTRALVDGGWLTDREIDVLDLLAQGQSNATIARSLGLTTKTVQNHVSRILDKLHVSDRTQAALWARDHAR